MFRWKNWIGAVASVVLLMVSALRESIDSSSAGAHRVRVVGGASSARVLGAGIGIAINENTGDHENNVAWATGLGGAGAVLGALAGHLLRPHNPAPASATATATTTAATTASATASGQAEAGAPRGAFRLQQVEDPPG